MTFQSSCQSVLLCIVYLLFASQLLVGLTSADDGQNVRLPARFGKRADVADSAAANVPLLKMLMRGGSAEFLNSEASAVQQTGPLYMLVPVKGGSGLGSAGGGYLMSKHAEETPTWK